MGADQHIDWNAAAASALDWWHDAGVDTLVDEAPHQWLAAAVAAPATPAGPAALAPDRPAALPDTIEAFAAWRTGPAAPDGKWGRAIAPTGDVGSGLMVLIDMPEREDADTGVLLSGDAGRLFDRMLAAIGRDRQSIYLASLAVARAPSGQIAAEWLDELTRLARHHVALARPKRVLLLGNAASRALLGANVAAARTRFHVLNHDRGTSEVVASFHPKFLLEQPARKAEAWRDLQMLIGGFE
ncbi:uracil-DNA glycosylase [Sphingomonas koreensis]|nr:uracil-DNA glycosylase [Sphingomonas koreensis]